MSPPVWAVVELVGLAVAVGLVAASLAAAYRAHLGAAIQPSLAILGGLGVLAVYLNTTAALGQVMSDDAVAIGTVLFNAGAVLAGVIAGSAGRRAGDRIGQAIAERRGSPADLGRAIAAVGRTTTVDLPETITDAVGYDPIDEGTRTAIAGRSMTFPRGLTPADVETRLADRLRRDHGVAYVDATVDEDGTVTDLVLGARPAGLGPTLPADTAAMAVRADPPLAAAPGDVVQVFDDDRVTTGEIRGVAGDIVTVAMPAAETDAIEPDHDYRLVTVGTTADAGRAAAGVLRRADETVAVIAVDATSPLVGLPVGALVSPVLAIVPERGATGALPPDDRLVATGDQLYVLDTPDRLAALRGL
ncbi:MAG: potassium transporter TrkA [Halococcoides sp.]